MRTETQTIDCKDMVEALKCDIDVSADFFQIIMGQYENSNPDKLSLQTLYFDTQTYCFVMFDRFCEMQQKVKQLVDMIYKK